MCGWMVNDLLCVRYGVQLRVPLLPAASPSQRGLSPCGIFAGRYFLPKPRHCIRGAVLVGMSRKPGREGRTNQRSNDREPASPVSKLVISDPVIDPQGTPGAEHTAPTPQAQHACPSGLFLVSLSPFRTRLLTGSGSARCTRKPPPGTDFRSWLVD